ncbi:MAG: hypothetical protein R3338_01895 [Thermoanaerobaculia bacterium]|nr:hypothetical protein [Thermoanaerobaculia bacterium]
MRLIPLIQRAFESTIANWPLLLIRVAASVAMTVVVLIAVIPIVFFAIYSGTMSGIESVTTSADMLEWLWRNAIVVAALLVAITLIVAVAIAIHAFVSGGVAGVFLDADRAAPREAWTRAQLAAFTPDRWLGHATRTWWPIFIIYNLTWGIWFLVLMLPLVIVIPLFIGMAENEVLGIAGCVILFFWVFAAIVGSIIVHVWTELAVLDCVAAEMAKIIAPIRHAFSILMKNAIRVIALVLLMFLIAIATSGVSVGMQIGFELGMQIDELAFLLIPVQIMFSLIQTMISVFVGAWLMACFATIVNESPHHRPSQTAPPPAQT